MNVESMRRRELFSILTILVIWLVLFAYVKSSCYLSQTYMNLKDQNSNSKFIDGVFAVCHVHWKFALFYCLAYTIVKLWWTFNRNYISIPELTFYTVCCYCILFAWSGIYLLLSFIQSGLVSHSLLHFILIGIFLEWIYRKYFPRLPNVKKENIE